MAALGAIKGVRDYVNSQKAQSTKSEETSIDYDYSRLKNRVYNKVSQIGVSVTKSWDEVVEANHTKLNSVILTSDYSEQFKSVLLSIVSKEVTFSNSSSDLLAKMSVAAKKEDLTMLKQVEEEYFTTLKNKLNESYKEQLFVYEKLLNQIELGEGDSSKELAKELR